MPQQHRNLAWLSLVGGILMLLAGAAGVMFGVQPWTRGDTTDRVDWISLATTLVVLAGAWVFIRQGYQGVYRGKPFTSAFLLASAVLSLTVIVLILL